MQGTWVFVLGLICGGALLVQCDSLSEGELARELPHTQFDLLHSENGSACSL